ncbi:hypothetical protein B0H14DRAFT_3735260 [Mycena olivaceomarginata]|nr:hypothetical protein B0H14DRAFT_3735260 [Mycena olivaceomarginata]
MTRSTRRRKRNEIDHDSATESVPSKIRRLAPEITSPDTWTELVELAYREHELQNDAPNPPPHPLQDSFLPTLKEVRAFLHFSYAGPLQMMPARIPDGDLRTFLGLIYYHLVAEQATLKPMAHPRSLRAPIPLMSWELIIMKHSPLTLPVCTPAKNCACHSDWLYLWSAAVIDALAVSVASHTSILERVSVLKNNLAKRWGSTNCPAVAHKVKHAMDGVLEELEASLADHFLGPEK